MTDKQIIIDGVDVSGCIVFNNKWGTLLCNPLEDIRTATHCDEYPDCLYKKYKRKEQECERLKEEVSLLRESNLKLQQIEDVKSLEKCYLQQLDQLKEQITYQRNFIESLLLATNNSEWLDKSILDDEASEIIEKIEIDYVEFEEVKEIYAELKVENEKLKQTLAEIKAIAKFELNNLTESAINGGRYVEILQKISEVENDKSNN